MSFGFSVSDIVGCARLAYHLYNEFRQAPRECQEFARELLLFHEVLLKTKSAIEPTTDFEGSRFPSDSDKATLQAQLDGCKELLFVQIIGMSEVPERWEQLEIVPNDPRFVRSVLFRQAFTTFTTGDGSTFLKYWRRKLDERKFALKIPSLQRAISSRIEKLTAFNVLLVQCVYVSNVSLL